MGKEITFKFKPDYTKFVNVNRWFSYEDIHWHIIVGGRGIGKTTGLNFHNVGDFIKRGSEFVYSRRYITELKKTKSMIPALVNNAKCNGLGHGLIQWSVNKTRIGYGVALTAQQTLKSGVDFSNVDVMVYDEAILPRGGGYRYLPNEVEMVFELVSTIFRNRKNYHVFILGNNADMFNPFFAYFNIPKFENIYIDKKRGLHCELCRNSPALIEDEKQTPLYKLTQGTGYGDYHYNNQVLGLEDTKIGVKGPKDYFVCRFVYNNFTINLYRRDWNDWLAELRDKVIADDKAYILMENNKPNYLYIKKMREDIGHILTICYYKKYLSYTSSECASIFDLIMEVC